MRYEKLEVVASEMHGLLVVQQKMEVSGLLEPPSDRTLKPNRYVAVEDSSDHKDHKSLERELVFRVPFLFPLNLLNSFPVLV